LYDHEKKEGRRNSMLQLNMTITAKSYDSLSEILEDVQKLVIEEFHQDQRFNTESEGETVVLHITGKEEPEPERTNIG
jgi:hypothetical protein